MARQIGQAGARGREVRDTRDRHTSRPDPYQPAEHSRAFQTALLSRANLLSWRSRLRAAYSGLVRQNSSPDKMAKGLALGVFLGIFPTFGAGSALALVVSSWLGWNRVAAALGTLIANPLLNPLFLSLSVITGNLFVPSRFRIVLEGLPRDDWWPGLLRFLPTHLLGNLLVSMALTALAHVVGRMVITRYRESRAKDLELAGGCKTDLVARYICKSTCGFEI
jgi:uncharacterized protein (DUF2062 family)